MRSNPQRPVQGERVTQSSAPGGVPPCSLGEGPRHFFETGGGFRLNTVIVGNQDDHTGIVANQRAPDKRERACRLESATRAHV
jgi:hypothetical protein